MGRGRPGGGCRPIGFHPPNTANGNVEVAANIGAIDVQVSVPVAVVRGVAVRAIRIAVNAAIVRRSHGTAAPAAPGCFGRNNNRNQAKKVPEQRNHGSLLQQNERTAAEIMAQLMESMLSGTHR